MEGGGAAPYRDLWLAMCLFEIADFLVDASLKWMTGRLKLKSMFCITKTENNSQGVHYKGSIICCFYPSKYNEFLPPLGPCSQPALWYLNLSSSLLLKPAQNSTYFCILETCKE